MLSAIAGQQENPTEETEKRLTQFLDYMSTHNEAKIRYYASDMILNVQSDPSHLTAPKARSCMFICLNSTILTLCTILKCVAASTA